MKQGYNDRIRKKIYLHDIYWDILSRYVIYLACGLKDTTDLKSIRALRKLFKSQLKGTGNPFYQSSRLNKFIDEALELSRKI